MGPQARNPLPAVGQNPRFCQVCLPTVCDALGHSAQWPRCTFPGILSWLQTPLCDQLALAGQLTVANVQRADHRWLRSHEPDPQNPLTTCPGYLHSNFFVSLHKVSLTLPGPHLLIPRCPSFCCIQHSSKLPTLVTSKPTLLFVVSPPPPTTTTTSERLQRTGHQLQNKTKPPREKYQVTQSVSESFWHLRLRRTAFSRPPTPALTHNLQRRRREEFST